MTCAGVTIYAAIPKAGLKPGDVIAVSGLGALGHIGVQIAKANVSAIGTLGAQLTSPGALCCWNRRPQGASGSLCRIRAQARCAH